MPSDHDIKQRETDFHNHRYGQARDPRLKLAPFYSITAASNDLYKRYIAQHATAGKKLLEYGCGVGGYVDLYKTLGCEVYGVDISSEAIAKATTKAADAGIAAHYVVGDAEKTDFADNAFDVVVGSGILHHLHLQEALTELARITAPNGACIFAEPMGHNPIINAFRALTPNLRSPDEHPLYESDMALMRQFFKTVTVNYFYLFSLASVLFRKTPLFSPVFRALYALDTALIRRFPSVGKYAWVCILLLEGPIKKTAQNDA